MGRLDFAWTNRFQSSLVAFMQWYNHFNDVSQIPAHSNLIKTWMVSKVSKLVDAKWISTRLNDFVVGLCEGWFDGEIMRINFCFQICFMRRANAVTRKQHHAKRETMSCKIRDKNMHNTRNIGRIICSGRIIWVFWSIKHAGMQTSITDSRHRTQCERAEFGNVPGHWDIETRERLTFKVAREHNSEFSDSDTVEIQFSVSIPCIGYSQSIEETSHS